jgi:hypothetical protein
VIPVFGVRFDFRQEELLPDAKAREIQVEYSQDQESISESKIEPEIVIVHL